MRAGHEGPTLAAMSLTAHLPETPIHGPGWAIQRMGPWVLGHWNESLNELRVIECRKLYRAARDAHGRFQVLAVFRGYPAASRRP